MPVMWAWWSRTRSTGVVGESVLEFAVAELMGDPGGA
jgi:hypothetical protein